MLDNRDFRGCLNILGFFYRVMGVFGGFISRDGNAVGCG